jgi:enoyl-CoA hydratase/carnithine racemase
MSRFRASAAFTGNWRHFELTVQEGVATVTLNRPGKLNALTFDTYADLRDLFGELPLREDVRAIVLTGEGRAFAPAATCRRSSASCRRWKPPNSCGSPA